MLGPMSNYLEMQSLLASLVRPRKCFVDVLSNVLGMGTFEPMQATPLTLRGVFFCICNVVLPDACIVYHSHLYAKAPIFLDIAIQHM